MRLIRLLPLVLLVSVACDSAPGGLTATRGVATQNAGSGDDDGVVLEAYTQQTVRQTYALTAALAREIEAGRVSPVLLTGHPRYAPFTRTGHHIEHVSADSAGRWAVTVRAPRGELADDPGVRCTARGGTPRTEPQVTCTSLDALFVPRRRRGLTGHPAGADSLVFIATHRPRLSVEEQRDDDERQARLHKQASDDDISWILTAM